MDRALQARLGRISNSSLGIAIEAIVAAGQSAVFKSNFDRRLFSPVLAKIYERVPFYTVQAHLVCQGEVLVERFKSREGENRHPGHQGLRDLERISRVLLGGPDEAMDLPEGETFRFDTTEPGGCYFGPFFEAVARRLGARDTI
ncbi:hypothetical protein EON81_01880 [bacterium]|nr:MAG: hypothetical protein EON81_01880 [bacterium]